MQKGLGARTVALIALAFILVAGALVATGQSLAQQASDAEVTLTQTLCVSTGCEGDASGTISTDEPNITAGMEQATVGRQSSVTGTVSTYTPSSPESGAPFQIVVLRRSRSRQHERRVSVTCVRGSDACITTDDERATGITTWTFAGPHFLAPGDTFEYTGGAGGCAPVAPTLGARTPSKSGNSSQPSRRSPEAGVDDGQPRRRRPEAQPDAPAAGVAYIPAATAVGGLHKVGEVISATSFTEVAPAGPIAPEEKTLP